MRLARQAPWVVMGALGLGFEHQALAADAAACADAAVAGQELRDAHRLMEARERFRICGQPECPRFIANDCSKWLTDVDKSLPTVVLAAKDGTTGAYLVDVSVLLDGKPFLRQLDGRAQPMDAGPHVFRFVHEDGRTTEQRVPIREGEKNQNVTAVFSGNGEAHVSSSPGADAADQPMPKSGVPWKTIGWIGVATGAVGLAVGATFGLMVPGDKNGAHCDSAGFCDHDALATARSHATISTVSFIVGGAFLATGIGLVLFAPNGEQMPARTGKRAHIVPGIGPHSAGVLVEAPW